MQSLRGLASNFFEILILKKGLDAVEGKKTNVLKQIYDLVTEVNLIV